VLNKKLLKLEIEFDFVLVALACSLKDYRLCYLLNKNLRINLRKITDIEIVDRKFSTHSFYSHFVSVEEHLEINLLSNRGIDHFLIPEMKQLDYFMIIKGFIDDEDLTDLLKNLTRIAEVSYTTLVDPHKLKSKNNLIF